MLLSSDLSGALQQHVGIQWLWHVGIVARIENALAIARRCECRQRNWLSRLRRCTLDVKRHRIAEAAMEPRLTSRIVVSRFAQFVVDLRVVNVEAPAVAAPHTGLQLTPLRIRQRGRRW
jgi:hypothetical protein